MFELGDISGADYGVSGVNQAAPSKVSHSAKAAHLKKINETAARTVTIQYPVSGRMTGVRQEIPGAGKVICLTQTLQSALDELCEKNLQRVVFPSS